MLWSKRADGVVAVHHAGPRLLPAVDLYDDLQPGGTQPHRAGVSVRSYASTGHLIAATTRTVADPDDSQATSTVTSAGDFQADGAADLLVMIDGPKLHGVQAWLNGRTGHLHRLSGLAFPVEHLTGKPGAALVTFSQRGHALHLSAGPATGAAYWRRELREPIGYGPTATSFAASSRRCADVLVSPDFWPSGGVAAVYTGSGHLLWTLRTSGNALLGGQVRTYAVPSRSCAR